MSDDRKRICSTHRWLRKRYRAVFEEQTCFPYLVITEKVLHCTVRCLLKHLEPTISIVGKGISGLYQDPSTHKTFWGHLGLVWCRGFLGPKRNTDRQWESAGQIDRGIIWDHFQEPKIDLEVKNGM